MSANEFASWVEFYKLFPFDDRHRYYRPAAMVSLALGGGGKFEERMEFLAPLPTPVPEGLSPVDASVLAALGLKPKPKKKE